MEVKRKGWQVMMLFITPALTIYTLLWILPLVANFGVSLTAWKGITGLQSVRFVGLRNYFRALTDTMFSISLLHNLIYGILTFVIQVTMAFIIAVLIERYVKGKAFFRTVLFLPVVLPWIVVALLWKWLLNPVFGLINGLLEIVGLGALARPWLGDSNIALYVLIAVGVWKATPFYMVIFLAGLQGIPRELEEAAQIDGASTFRTFISVIIPLLKPVFTIVIALSLIDGFRVFDLVYAMTQGGPGNSTEVLSTYIYRTAFFDFRMSYASALSIMLFLVVFVLSFICLRPFLSREEVQY